MSKNSFLGYKEMLGGVYFPEYELEGKRIVGLIESINFLEKHCLFNHQESVDYLKLLELDYCLLLKPAKVVKYYSYSKKCLRGDDVIQFDIWNKPKHPLIELHNQLDKLQKNNDPNHTRDNKTVYVYETKGWGGKIVAAMFKDGRIVIGSEKNVKDYYDP